MSFMGQDSRKKMTSPGGKLTGPVLQWTIKVNKTEESTWLSTNIAFRFSPVKFCAPWGCTINYFMNIIITVS